MPEPRLELGPRKRLDFKSNVSTNSTIQANLKRSSMNLEFNASRKFTLPKGFEPLTYSLEGYCSSIELRKL